MTLMKPEDLFLPAGYVQREQPLFDNHAEIAGTGECWQAAVYDLALALAPGVGARRVIDVGCGYAEKLVPFANSFKIIGIDREENVSHCRGHHAFGEWVAADLERGIPADAPIPIRESLVICADVLEHLINPIPLLHSFARWRKQGAAAMLLSTPERVTEYRGEHMGPSANPCHVREWAEAEFLALLKSVDLAPLMCGRVDSHRGAGDMATTVAVIVA